MLKLKLGKNIRLLLYYNYTGIGCAHRQQTYNWPCNSTVNSSVQFRQLSVVADYAYEDQSVVERRFRLLLSFSKFAAWSHLAPSWRLLRHETRSEQADVQEVGSMLKSRRSLFRTSLQRRRGRPIGRVPFFSTLIIENIRISFVSNRWETGKTSQGHVTTASQNVLRIHLRSKLRDPNQYTVKV